MALFDFKKKTSRQYLLLSPAPTENSLLSGEGQMDWALLSQEELDEKVESNELAEDSRLFIVEREVKIHFQKTTHLD